jgi:hypothetical protein
MFSLCPHLPLCYSCAGIADLTSRTRRLRGRPATSDQKRARIMDLRVRMAFPKFVQQWV